jgi:hypothetical protein
MRAKYIASRTIVATVNAAIGGLALAFCNPIDIAREETN